MCLKFSGICAAEPHNILRLAAASCKHGRSLCGKSIVFSVGRGLAPAANVREFATRNRQSDIRGGLGEVLAFVRRVTQDTACGGMRTPRKIKFCVWVLDSRRGDKKSEELLLLALFGELM